VKRYEAEVVKPYVKELYNGLDCVVWVANDEQEKKRIARLLQEAVKTYRAHEPLPFPRPLNECFHVVPLSAWPPAAWFIEVAKKTHARAQQEAAEAAKREAENTRLRQQQAAQEEENKRTRRAYEIGLSCDDKKTRDELVDAIVEATGWTQQRATEYADWGVSHERFKTCKMKVLGFPI
jgi:hypothetical protein